MFQVSDSISHPRDLPDFGDPPVVEVVFSIQFEAVAEFSAPYIGLLWQRFRSEFPEVEEHPPIQDSTESFDPPRPPTFQVHFADRPTVPRVWFLNTERTRLLQVQPTRFIHNWRKHDTDRAYPRYETQKADFQRECATLREFLKDEDLGQLRISQCEISYINHIFPGAVWQTLGEASAVFTSLKSTAPNSWLPAPEDLTFRSRHRITDDSGKPFGRLATSISPAWHAEHGTPLFVMELTARGAPKDHSLDAAFDFFDIGRRWIVRGFAEMTTKEMHHVWRRTDI
jgi:uncharacterized protein (TIGR04255 family)